MRVIMKAIIKMMLVTELTFFIMIYFFGPYGMPLLQQLREDIVRIREGQEEVYEHVASLEHHIYAWEAEPFYKEKEAREQLHMARPYETIYVY